MHICNLLCVSFDFVCVCARVFVWSVCVCAHALSGLSLSAIGSDTEGDGEDMFSDVEIKPNTNPEPR